MDSGADSNNSNLIIRLGRQWEEAAQMPDRTDVRQYQLRTGLLIVSAMLFLLVGVEMGGGYIVARS